MEYKFVCSGKSYKVNIEPKSNEQSYLVSIENNKPLTVELVGSTPNCFSFTMDGKLITTYTAEHEDKMYVFVNGESFVLELEKAKSTQRTQKTMSIRGVTSQRTQNTVVSPMPGALVKLLVAQGDKVEIGQTLAIVEAMKMENELKAPSNGVVKKINFKEGTQVDALQPIVELEAGN